MSNLFLGVVHFYIIWMTWGDRAINIFQMYLLNGACENIKAYSVKPAHVVTSIKQSPVLKGHIFLVLS